MAWSLQGSNFRGECALVREEPAGGTRDPGTRRGPRPLPEQQPGTGPPSFTPANRRRTRSGATSPRGRQPLADAGAALTRREPLGSPGKPWQAPPHRKGPRSGSEAGPPNLGARPAGALSQGRRAAGARGSMAGRTPSPSPQAPGPSAWPRARRPRSDPCPVGPRAAAAPQPRSIHRAAPSLPAGWTQGPRGQDQPGGARQENKKLREELT